MKFKPLTKFQLEEIVDLFIKSFNSEPWNDEWSMETAYKRLNQMMNCEGFYGLLAYEEEKLVGMILGNYEYYYNGMQFLIKEFCIDNTSRGTGKGKILIEEFEKRLREKGIGEVLLMTSRTELTQGFYEKRGYKEVNNLVMMAKNI